MNVLVDNQMPVALARFLSSCGVDCKHVLDIGLANATDAEIWKQANRKNCAVFKDEDFLYLSNGPGGEGAVRLDSVRELPSTLGCN